MRNGSTGPIRLSFLGPSMGLSIMPDTIPEGAVERVCTIAADHMADIGVRTFQITGTCDGERFLVRTRPLIDKRTQNVDLIPIALREDQMRLPPSLADRLAVQITPPSPFRVTLTHEEIKLPRYQSATVPVFTSRDAEFNGPITFTATGGQLADKNEGRTRVYAEFPNATAKQPTIDGVVVSKILSNIGKARIEVTATGTHEGRRITLIRSFALDLTYAYAVRSETPKVALLPGESCEVTLRRRPREDVRRPGDAPPEPDRGAGRTQNGDVSKGRTLGGRPGEGPGRRAAAEAGLATHRDRRRERVRGGDAGRGG